MITILKLEEASQGSLKYVVTVSIEKWGGFVIEEIRMFESSGKRWFHFPCKPIVKTDGTKKYLEYNRFRDKNMTLEFQKKLFNAVDEYLMNKYASENESSEPA